jgi:hypothetical protein
LSKEKIFEANAGYTQRKEESAHGHDPGSRNKGWIQRGLSWKYIAAMLGHPQHKRQ